jgi:hypothetical protein
MAVAVVPLGIEMPEPLQYIERCGEPSGDLFEN